MALILGSFEEYHGLECPNLEVWAKTKSILVTESALHRDHIEYYSCLDADNEGAYFPITPLMRSIEFDQQKVPE